MVARLLRVLLTKADAYATLPAAGDTAVGAIVRLADSKGIDMASLKNHLILGYSLWRMAGGPEHQLILLSSGVYYVELKITMANGKSDRHVVVYDAGFRRAAVGSSQAVVGCLLDNKGPVKLLHDSDRKRTPGSPPPAREAFRSIFPGAARVAVANAWMCTTAAQQPPAKRARR